MTRPLVRPALPVVAVLVVLAACKGGESDNNTQTDPPTDSSTDTDTTDTVTDTDTPTDTDTETTPAAPVFVLAPAIAPPDTTSWLMEDLTLETDVPTRVSVALDDGVSVRTLEFPTLATAHAQPLLGLYANVSYTATVTATAEDGTSVSADVPFTVGGLPAVWPHIEMLVDEPGQEPGWLLAPLDSLGSDAYIAILDGKGVPVWITQVKPEAVSAVPKPDLMGFAAIQSHEVFAIDRDGREVARYTDKALVNPTDIQTAIDFNHDVWFDVDGSFWALTNDEGAGRLPADYDQLGNLVDVSILDDAGAHVAADGTVLFQQSFYALLDQDRIGWDSLDPTDGGLTDWSHANGWQPAGPDYMLASLRHQDAVLKMDRATGEIQWILGNPDGWDNPWKKLLLTPIGGTEWQYHQHAPMWHPSGDGRIVMFDNGNDRSTPYNPANGPALTRIVEFAVDEVNQTVTETWSYVNTSTGAEYSQALGNADYLPTTDHVLATYAYLHKEGGVQNTDIGRGDRSCRIVEIDPATLKSVREISVWGDLADTPEGWQFDRAVLMPRLYPADVVDSASP